jgi:hypothetical protein
MDGSRPACIRVLNGLGDSIYHRPFLRGNWCVHTRYPELFKDLDVSFNCGREPDIVTRYDSKSLKFRHIIGCISKFFKDLDTFKFDLPEFEKPDIQNYVVIRLTQEWSICTKLRSWRRKWDIRRLGPLSNVMAWNILMALCLMFIFGIMMGSWISHP